MSTETSYTPKDLFPPLWISVLLIAAGIAWLLIQLKEMLVLLVVGYSVAYAIHPIVTSISRRGLTRSQAVLIVFSVIGLVIALLALTVLPTLISEGALLLNNLPEYIKSFKDFIRNLPSRIEGLLPAAFAQKLQFDSLLDSIPAIDGETLKSILSAVISALVGGYSITLTIVNLTLLPFIVFYLADGMPKLNRWFLSLFPTRLRPEVRAISFEINDLLRAFIRGQFLVGSVLFLLFAIGLSFIGIKLWFLLAVISGFGQMVPYLGFALGIVLSSIMTVVTFGEWSPLFMVWGLYATIQILEGFVITPRIVGESVGMSPLEIIIALFAGGTLFGLLGIFLAVPAAAAIKVLVRHGYSKFMDRLEVE